MALIQRCLSKTNTLGYLSLRCFSTPVGVKDSKKISKDIKKSVFISQSKDVFTNLALEDWLYRNFDFSRHHVLMLWQNEPSVTLGKSQNPWHEVNLPNINHVTENGVKLARRNTNGDAVYHDDGALNMTFFTSNQNYDGRYNLEIIRRALFREFEMRTDITSQDIKIRNEKQVSKTSNRIGEANAYHHCNLLVNISHKDKSQVFDRQGSDVISNIPDNQNHKLMNLNDANRKITVKGLLKAIGWEYMRTEALALRDGGLELANQQKGFQMINPTEKWFPGITEIRDQLTSWEWCYGATPTFNISRSFRVPEYLLNSIDFSSECLKITMEVEQGRIKNVTLYLPPGLSSNGFAGEINVVTNLKGRKFTEEALNSIEWSLDGIINEKEKFVTDCVRQVMQSV